MEIIYSAISRALKNIKYFYCQDSVLFKSCMFLTLLNKFHAIYFKINFLDIKVNMVQLNSKFAKHSFSLRLRISTGLT